MALVDFYQLAVLYNLSRGDAGVLSNHSNPFPMSATISSRSHSSAVDSDQLGSPPPPPTQTLPKTPERKRDTTHLIPDPTPIALGTSILQKMKLDTGKAQKYDSDKYEEYIIRDFERHRVFVDIDVFMTHVLHVPENWKELWGRTIRRVKRDAVFSTAHWDYSRRCGTHGIQERTFYKPLVDMGNAILDFSETSPDDSVKPRTPQRYLRNDPKKVLCGVIGGLSPDVVAVHDGFLPHICSEERDKKRLKESNLTWAQPLQALEVKPWDSALVDGSCMPRLKVNGRDPQLNHVHPCTPSRRYPRKNTASPTTGAPIIDQVFSAPDLLSRKRPADESLEPNRKTRKVHHWSTPGGANGSEKRLRKPQTKETDGQKAAYLQVGRYLLEQFSVPAFRSHATIGLVDRDRIQFYHANHSVILVSSAINFSVTDREGGLDKFIAIVIAFSRLSLRDNGILHNLHNGKLFRDNENLPISDLARGAIRMQEGNKLEFGGNEETGPFTLTYGELISHEPSLAGRSTVVLHAKSPTWKDVDLVVKISWPGSERVAENAFLDKAVNTAESTPEGKWALDHLPRVLFTQDVVFDSDSTHERVASLFDKAEFVGEEYEYERRTLRIIIQERLYPLETLKNAKDVAQVLLDVLCIHRWLYEEAGILHRDLSLNNIMYRILKKENDAGVTEKKVHGVLTDYDLSSWTASLTPDYTKTSQQRTGTPPFMAHGLLDGTDTLHLYRHDVESIFYIMLILATHYEIQAPKKGKGGGLRMRKGQVPFQGWFDAPDYGTLSEKKLAFFARVNSFEVSPSFKDFHDWLLIIYASFVCGFGAKRQHDVWRMMRQPLLQGLKQAGGEPTSPEFDEGTLGGHVTYSVLINPARHLTGKLSGLAVRYDPPPPPPLVIDSQTVGV